MTKAEKKAAEAATQAEDILKRAEKLGESGQLEAIKIHVRRGHLEYAADLVTRIERLLYDARRLGVLDEVEGLLRVGHIELADVAVEKAQLAGRTVV